MIPTDARASVSARFESRTARLWKLSDVEQMLDALMLQSRDEIRQRRAPIADSVYSRHSLTPLPADPRR